MENFSPLFTQTLSVLTIIAQALIVFLAVRMIFKIKLPGALENFLIQKGLLLAFVVALVATLGSLIYSEIIGFEPCKLCWFQRIFMYPQVIILGIALFIKDRNAATYALILSLLGAITAAYHYLMQIGFVSGGSCDVIGYSASCSQRFFMSYEYITIPMMALTAFVLIILFSTLSKKEKVSSGAI